MFHLGFYWSRTDKIWVKRQLFKLAVFINNAYFRVMYRVEGECLYRYMTDSVKKNAIFAVKGFSLQHGWAKERLQCWGQTVLPYCCRAGSWCWPVVLLVLHACIECRVYYIYEFLLLNVPTTRIEVMMRSMTQLRRWGAQNCYDAQTIVRNGTLRVCGLRQTGWRLRTISETRSARRW